MVCYRQCFIEFFNFGQDIRKWISTFYTETSSCVLNNGHFSPFFNLSRGVRQGDPLSPYLFIIVVELMAIALKNTRDVHGIKLFNTDYLLGQYADDTFMF